MGKIIVALALLAFVFTICGADSTVSLITSMLFSNKMPERVRTVEEYNTRSNESVILDFVSIRAFLYI